jgi:hypothetical protein
MRRIGGQRRNEKDREEQRKLMQGMGKGTKSDRAKALKKRQGGPARQKEGSMVEVEVAERRGNINKLMAFNDFFHPCIFFHREY